MACGTPVVTVPDPALLEIVGDAAVVVEAHELGDGIRRAIAERDELVRGRSRAGPSLLVARAPPSARSRVYREVLER